ncbi:ParB family protein [Vibrio sp. WXL103]|uniref:ParB family protein n=1 Tax=Vibrio sp. WXL103 TaxID=3450710 RepID=UPI003EC5DC66
MSNFYNYTKDRDITAFESNDYKQKELHIGAFDSSVLDDKDNDSEKEDKKELEAIWNKLYPIEGISVEPSGVSFPMKNGQMAVFDLVTIEPEKILFATKLHSENGREQEALNSQESLEDIIPTLGKAGNFQPGIANIGANGLLEVMDGSRRRMACYLKCVPYRLYVPRNPIGVADARYVSDLSLIQKALSYREKGIVNAKIMLKNNFTEVVELAVYLFGESYERSEYETLRVQLQAADIPILLCEIIPDFNNLTVRQYKDLIKISDAFYGKEKELLKYVEVLKQRVANIDERKKITIKKFKSSIVHEMNKLHIEWQSEGQRKEQQIKSEKTTLYRHDKNKYITKVVNGDSTIFQLNRGDKDLISKIEDVIYEYAMPSRLNY